MLLLSLLPAAPSLTDQVKPHISPALGRELMSEESILDHLSSNFLTYLVDGRMPDTKVIVGEKEFDLRSHFTHVFKHEQTHTFTVDLRGAAYEFKCDVSRVERGKPFSRHALMFFADNRLLGAGRAIENKIGKPAFERPTARNTW